MAVNQAVLELVAKDLASGELRLVSSSLDQTKQSAENASKELGGMTSATSASQMSLSSLGVTSVVVAAGIASLTAAAAAAALKMLDLGYSVFETSVKVHEADKFMGKLALTAGMGVADFQALSVVISNSGGNAQQLAMAMRMLTMQMTQAKNGVGESVALFQRLGITVTDASGNLRSTTDVFGEVTRALGALDAGVARNSFAFKLFSEASGSILPVIDELNRDGLRPMSQNLKELGVTLDEVRLNRAYAFGSVMDDMSLKMSAFSTIIGRETVDAFIGLVGKINEVTETILKSGVVQDIGKAFSDIIKSIADQTPWDSLKDGILKAVEQSKKLSEIWQRLSVDLGILLPMMEAVVKTTALLMTPLGLLITGFGTLGTAVLGVAAGLSYMASGSSDTTKELLHLADTALILTEGVGQGTVNLVKWGLTLDLAKTKTAETSNTTQELRKNIEQAAASGSDGLGQQIPAAANKAKESIEGAAVAADKLAENLAEDIYKLSEFQKELDKIGSTATLSGPEAYALAHPYDTAAQEAAKKAKEKGGMPGVTTAFPAPWGGGSVTSNGVTTVFPTAGTSGGGTPTIGGVTSPFRPGGINTPLQAAELRGKALTQGNTLSQAFTGGFTGSDWQTMAWAGVPESMRPTPAPLSSDERRAISLGLAVSGGVDPGAFGQSGKVSIPGYAGGTGIFGTDSILARLTPGEIVLSVQESEAVRAAAKAPQRVVDMTQGTFNVGSPDKTFEVAAHSVSRTSFPETQKAPSIGSFGRREQPDSGSRPIQLKGNVYMDSSQVGKAMFVSSSTGNAISSNGSVTTNLQ